MQNILTGIYNAYDGSSTLKSALSGGLHFLKAPQGVAYPYAVYSAEGGPEYMLGDTSYELPRIQFDIYAESNADRQTAYDALTTVFDSATPASTGYTPIIMRRNSYFSTRTGDQWQYFQATVLYDCRFEKQ